MNRHEERIKRLEQHLSVHPADHQTVISLLKQKSAKMAAQRSLHWHLMRQKIAILKRTM